MVPENERRPRDGASNDASGAGERADNQRVGQGSQGNKSHLGAHAQRDDVDLARDALQRLSPGRADNRDTWIRVGMALHAVSDSLLTDWVQWSRQSDKFVEGDCERQWKSFKLDKAQSLGLGSLIRWARDDSGDVDFAKSTPERGSSSRTLRGCSLSGTSRS